MTEENKSTIDLEGKREPSETKQVLNELWDEAYNLAVENCITLVRLTKTPFADYSSEVVSDCLKENIVTNLRSLKK